MGEECKPIIIRNTDGARHPDRNPNQKRLGSSHSFAASKGVTHFLYECPPSLLSIMLCEVTDLPMDVPYFNQRKKVKTNGIVAIKALSNKLARASYYIMRDHVPYDPKRLFR